LYGGGPIGTPAQPALEEGGELKLCFRNFLASGFFIPVGRLSEIARDISAGFVFKPEQELGPRIARFGGVEIPLQGFAVSATSEMLAGECGNRCDKCTQEQSKRDCPDQDLRPPKLQHNGPA